jgi:hypothetical protein
MSFEKVVRDERHLFFMYCFPLSFILCLDAKEIVKREIREKRDRKEIE